MSRNTTEPDPRKRHWLAATAQIVMIALLAYVLSSGPMIAAGCWLREATGWDGFYAVFWLYFPLLMLGHQSPAMVYIEWWVELFGTVGPG